MPVGARPDAAAYPVTPPTARPPAPGAIPGGRRQDSPRFWSDSAATLSVSQLVDSLGCMDSMSIPRLRGPSGFADIASSSPGAAGSAPPRTVWQPGPGHPPPVSQTAVISTSSLGLDRRGELHQHDGRCLASGGGSAWPVRRAHLPFAARPYCRLGLRPLESPSFPADGLDAEMTVMSASVGFSIMPKGAVISPSRGLDPGSVTVRAHVAESVGEVVSGCCRRRAGGKARRRVSRLPLPRRRGTFQGDYSADPGRLQIPLPVL